MERETRTGTSVGLHVAITKPGRDTAVKWEAFSGGEAQRLKLAGALALSETLLRSAGVRCDLMVLDEPTQHLSPEGVGDLIETLIELGRDRQLILVDHSARETRKFANVLTVVREPGTGSRIETGAVGTS
jgi:energy-coupling factor transporter ATP-binding protein EcfA2